MAADGGRTPRRVSGWLALRRDFVLTQLGSWTMDGYVRHDPIRARGRTGPTRPSRAPARSAFARWGFVLLLEAACATIEPVEHALTFGGFARSYLVHAPARAALAHEGSPLVVVLHGCGGDGRNVLEQGRWVEKAEADGFLVVAPEGLPEDPGRAASFFGNPRSWNSGPETGSPAEARRTDDVGFVAAVIADVRRARAVDARRIFVTGFSNGAGLAFRIGAELSDVVEAIAPVANGLLVPVDALRRPVSLLLVWGREDPVNPIGGGVLERAGHAVRRPSAEASWRRWAELLGCEGSVAVDRPRPGVTRRAAARCAGTSAAVLVEVEGLGHQWPGGRTYLRLISGPGSDALDATDEIWRFFMGHPR